MRITEIYTDDNSSLTKDGVKVDDYDGYIGIAKPSGHKIKGYEVYDHTSSGEVTLLIKDPNSDNFFGGLALINRRMFGSSKTGSVWMSQVGITPDIQGKGIAIELYKLALTHYKPIIVSDTEQTRGSKALWSKLSQDPEVNVYKWNYKTDEYVSWDPSEESDEEVYYNRRQATATTADASNKFEYTKQHIEELLADGEISVERAHELYDQAEETYIEDMEKARAIANEASNSVLVATLQDLS